MYDLIDNFEGAYLKSSCGILMMATKVRWGDKDDILRVESEIHNCEITLHGVSRRTGKKAVSKNI